jgi:hypothetical protein
VKAAAQEVMARGLCAFGGVGAQEGGKACAEEDDRHGCWGAEDRTTDV